MCTLPVLKVKRRFTVSVLVEMTRAKIIGKKYKNNMYADKLDGPNDVCVCVCLFN